MYKSFLIILSFFIATSAFCQETDVEAALNPEFLKWQANKLKTGISTGESPAPNLPNYDWLIEQTLKNTHTFDAVYDLRSLGIVTPPKDQEDCGACWTFTSLGSLESAMLKQNFGTFDFSEQNMRTCHGFVFGDNLACSGGNNRKATAYLTRGDGPLLENNVPYNTIYDAPCESSTSTQFTIDGANYYPDNEDILKQAILDYGALYTNMYYESESFTSLTNTYYYDGNDIPNHAVLIVGWDDAKSTNAGTGAWIIKNSWGEDWGENGYFYIAYQDSQVNTSVASFHGIKNKNGGDILHMYDELAWINSTGFGSGYAKALIKFTTSEAQTLTSIGTFATATNATIKAYVYGSKTDNILHNALGSTETTIYTHSGYHRIELIEPIRLEANKNFYIEVEYATNSYNFPIPFEKAVDDYASPNIKNDVCWISSNGDTWYPWGNDVLGKERDLCIRVYAYSSATSTHEITEDNKAIQIFPQPAKDEINLRLDENFINHNLLIFSLNGQLLSKHKIKKSTEKINLNNLATGLYLVRIENSNGQIIAQKRFIKAN